MKRKLKDIRQILFSDGYSLITKNDAKGTYTFVYTLPKDEVLRVSAFTVLYTQGNIEIEQQINEILG
jgi:hypothetical protein